MRLWIIMRLLPDDGNIRLPSACPHAGCDGRRFRVHQKHVAKPLRRTDGSPEGQSVAARRYRCLDCGRSFRVYPEGVDRGATLLPVKRLAAALCLLGLTVRDASAALALLGLQLGKSQVHAIAREAVARAQRIVARVSVGVVGARDVVVDAHDVAAVTPRYRTIDPRHWRNARLLGRLSPPEPGRGHASVMVNGHRLPLRATVDRLGRPALVIDGVDARTSLAEREWMGRALADLGVGVVCESSSSQPRRTPQPSRARRAPPSTALPES